MKVCENVEIECGITNQKPYPPLIVLSPKSMNYLNFNSISDIAIKVFPESSLASPHGNKRTIYAGSRNSHDKIQIEQEIEIPAFLDHWVTQDILQSHRINVLMRRQVLDMSKLDRR